MIRSARLLAVAIFLILTAILLPSEVAAPQVGMLDQQQSAKFSFLNEP